MHAIKIKYKNLNALYAALQAAEGVSSALADTINELPTGKGERQIGEYAMRRVLEAFETQTARGKRATHSIRLAMGQANIYPPHHALATHDEDIITLRFTLAAIHEISDSLYSYTTQMRAIAGPENTILRALAIICEIPLKLLREVAPLFFNALTEAKVPLF